MAKKPQRRAAKQVRRVATTPARGRPSTLAQLCDSPDQFLGRLDIAELNLICAGGLPGAEKLDLDRYFDWLDEAARLADFNTRRHWYRFLDSPTTYNKSPGYFCCYHLLQTLQEDCGVCYNPARIKDGVFQKPAQCDPDFKDSSDIFIHGIIDGPGGTCASMPVIYVAVGRRLGYPLKLVEARGHLFVRWDDPQGNRLGVPEVFNVEGAGEGIASYSDDFYRTWPEPWTDADKVGGWYLKSLSPTQELAAFLCTRAECLSDNGRIDEAIQAYRWVYGLVPEDARYRAQLVRLERKKIERSVEVQEIIALNRANRQHLLDGPLGRQARQMRPPHEQPCYCEQCREARANVPQPPHGESCRCFHCCQVRETAPPHLGAPGHPSACHCYECRQHRGPGGVPGLPYATQPW